MWLIFWLPWAVIPVLRCCKSCEALLGDMCVTCQPDDPSNSYADVFCCQSQASTVSTSFQADASIPKISAYSANKTIIIRSFLTLSESRYGQGKIVVWPLDLVRNWFPSKFSMTRKVDLFEIQRHVVFVDDSILHVSALSVRSHLLSQGARS